MDINDWCKYCNLNNIKNIQIIDRSDLKEKININNKNLKNIPDLNTYLKDFNLNEEKNKKSLLLLKDLMDLSSFLNKYYYQYTVKKKNILILLKKIIQINKILKDRLNLKTIKLNFSNINLKFIPRSSYKFCNFKDACKYNYNESKDKGCYAHHYVYDLLEFDLEIINYYINNYIEDNNLCNNKDIIKSFSTINYVIKHMYDELNSIKLYSKNKECIECYHKNNKKCKGKKNKNKIRKINF